MSNYPKTPANWIPSLEMNDWENELSTTFLNESKKLLTVPAKDLMDLFRKEADELWTYITDPRSDYIWGFESLTDILVGREGKDLADAFKAHMLPEKAAMLELAQKLDLDTKQELYTALGETLELGPKDVAKLLCQAGNAIAGYTNPSKGWRLPTESSPTSRANPKPPSTSKPSWPKAKPGSKNPKRPEDGSSPMRNS